MLKIFILAFGLYLVAGFVILSAAKLLARRWRILNWAKLLLCSLGAALFAVIALYCFVEFADDSNVGGGSGIGAVILMVMGLIAGGIVGLVILLMMAGFMSKKLAVVPRLNSKSMTANISTFILTCLMIPAFIILFDMFGRGEGFFVIAFCGMCFGVAGLRESLLLNSELDNFVITRRLLWVGLLSTIIVLLGFVVRYIIGGSILHSKSIVSLVIVLTALAIPSGIFIWRIRKARLYSQLSAGN